MHTTNNNINTKVQTKYKKTKKMYAIEPQICNKNKKTYTQQKGRK